MRATALALFLVVSFAPTSHADRGALTVDLGAGATLLLLPAPYTADSGRLPSTALMSRLGVRYALSDSFELAFSGAYEPRVSAYHSGVVVDTSAPGFTGLDAGRGPFEGTLAHDLERYALTTGARYVWGSVFRIHAGVDVGLAQRAYSNFEHFDTSSGSARSHGLRLASYTTSSFLVAPLIGIEWAFHDKWSVSVLPRAEFLLGTDALIGVSVPVLLSHSWYI